MLWQCLLTVLPMTLCSGAKQSVFYDTYKGTPLTSANVIHHVAANTTLWCTVKVDECDPEEGRRLDGSCNNLAQPSRGTTRTPLLKLLPSEYSQGFEPRRGRAGAPLQPSRRVRTALLATGVRADRYLTQLATHFFVYMASDVSVNHNLLNYYLKKTYCCLPEGKKDRECAGLEVPADDPVHRFSDVRCLNMTRPLSYQSYGCARNDTIPDLMTSSTPTFDMSSLYGDTLQSSLEKSRLFVGGLMKYEVVEGRVFPPATRPGAHACAQNQMPHETRCHDTPNMFLNLAVGINLFGVWFWRSHNRLAAALAGQNPCWSDERLFYTARDINIAVYNQIMLYEFLPAILGWDNLVKDSVVSPNPGFRDMYDKTLFPQVSVEFPYVLRWAHTMQEGRLKMYDGNGNYLKQIPIVNVTLRTGYLAVDNNLDYITQGSFRQASGKIDHIIDPDIAEKALGSLMRVEDVATIDIARGRYAGIPGYVKYRELCTGRAVHSFQDLRDVIDDDILELFEDVYQNKDDIDLLAGIWMERPVRGGRVPPTFYCLVAEQLRRTLRADRHWYERPNRPNAFTWRQLQEVRKASVSQLLCDVGDKVTHIQRRGFLRASPINEMVSCSEIEKMDLTAWTDATCSGEKRS